MDVEGLLQSVIRFSNFMTSRLVVSGVVFYVLSGFTEIGSTTTGLLPDADLLNEVVQNYQTIFDVLGVSDFALLLIFFLFLTTIHLLYVAFKRIGEYVPPAIVPLSGWDALDDVTLTAFDILREARGEEHTDEENQRLFEFKKKLHEIEAATDASYAERLAGVSSAYSISKAMIVFVILVALYALLSQSYTNDPMILAVILGFSVLLMFYTGFAIFRANYERIASLRSQVINQFLEFSRIWAPPEYQARMVAACVPSRDLRPVELEVVVPVYGTLDDLVEDFRRMKQKRRLRKAPPAGAADE
jgi:F0F1-type ATP synthase assembly protein I